MSDDEENPHSRNHIKTIYLCAQYDIALAELRGKLKIGEKAAILLMIGDGLHNWKVLPDDQFKTLSDYYKIPLLEKIEENKAKRENSHLSRLELAKQREDKLEIEEKHHEALLTQARLESGISQKEKSDALALKGAFEQWDQHQDLHWRITQIAFAKKHPENEYAKKIIAKENCDTVSQDGDIVSHNSKEASG